MKDRYDLLHRGLFPETLPPCFISSDLKRALTGIVKDLKAKAFHKRSSDYVRYNGTKHDGSRRYFGSPNPISYFHVASFIAEHWSAFETRFAETPFSVSMPKIASSTADRPIIIPSLSELTTVASKQLAHSPYILRADIAQFFPSLYTHSIPWSAHGIAAAKADPNPQSASIVFNKLDFFVRNCQLSETRGLLVGPDAFRLIAEFIIAGLDVDLNAKIKGKIVGVARHVDDYYIGLRGEPEVLEVLSALRDNLQRFHLNINDSKTKTMLGIEPLNDLWAQSLRSEAKQLKGYYSDLTERAILFVNKALEMSRNLSSASPLKIALRTLDQIRIYDTDSWGQIEPYLQRALFFFPHCIDYTALLVAKRHAYGKPVDVSGWTATSQDLLKQHLARNHHHEIVWLAWLLLSISPKLDDKLVAEICKNDNAHIRALMIAAFAKKKIDKKPLIKLGSKLETTDADWLVNIVSRSTGFSKASFSGQMTAEFEHLATKRVRFIDFKTQANVAKAKRQFAISRSRYGYDAEDYEEEVDLRDLYLDDIEE